MLEDNILKMRYNRFGNNFSKPIIKEEAFERVEFRYSLKSINIPELFFTNFFSSKMCQKYEYFKELYYKYINNSNMFNDLLAGDEIQNSNRDKLIRLCDIISKANNGESITIKDLVDNIVKFKFKKDITMQLYIKRDSNKYFVYLIDLYHLAIPATNQKTGRNDYKPIYKKREKCNYCLSNISNEQV